jgi:adenylate cyclase
VRVFTFGLAAAHHAAGRYEEAGKWADRSLAAQPNYRTAFLVKTAASAQLGRIAEAREWLGRALELEPGLTIARLASARLALPLVEGLRKAGLPEA